MVIWSDLIWSISTSKAWLLSEGSLSRQRRTPDLHDRGRSSPAQPAAWPPSPSPWQSPPPRSHFRTIYNHPIRILFSLEPVRDLAEIWMFSEWFIKKTKDTFHLNKIFQFDSKKIPGREYVVVVSERDHISIW